MNLKETNTNSIETVHEKDKNVRTEKNQKSEDKKDETLSPEMSVPDDKSSKAS